MMTKGAKPLKIEEVKHIELMLSKGLKISDIQAITGRGKTIITSIKKKEHKLQKIKANSIAQPAQEQASNKFLQVVNHLQAAVSLLKEINEDK